MRASPEIVNRKTGNDQREAGEALARIAGDLIQDDGETDERKDDRHDGKAPGAERRRVPTRAAQRHRAKGERAEEDPLRVDDARDDDTVRPGQYEHG